MGGSFGGLVEDVAVFASLDASARDFLTERLVPRPVAGGEVLIREGEPADALYLIAEGRVRVQSRRADGSPQVLAELGRGEIVGEMALVTDEPRSATVTAVRDSLVLELPASAFVELVGRHPEVLRDVTSKVVARLLRSLRGATPTSPASTVAVVPLADDPDVHGYLRDLARAFTRVVGSSRLVDREAATQDLGDVDTVGITDLASWVAAQERTADVVVLQTAVEPDAWTDLCVRQADVVLLVAPARSPARTRPVEELVRDRREHIPVRTHLVLVHPRGTRDPSGTRRWLASRDPELHHHVAVGREADADRVARLVMHRGIGIVFSGGGARGIAGLGVLRALEELSVPYDAVGGVSIGALVGGGAARGVDPDTLAAMLRASVVDRSPFDVTFPAVSLAAGKRVTRHLRDAAAGLDLEDLWRPFFCVSTNLTRGDLEVHRRGPVWHAIRASFSIPGVFPPVRSADGDLLVDGGVLDNLPVGVMRGAHTGITVLTVDVRRARDVGGADLPGDGVVSGWRVLLGRLDPNARGHDRAGLGRILLRLTELGTEREGDPGDVRIRPAIEHYGLTDFDAFDRLVDLGYDAAMAVLPDWLAARSPATRQR